MSRLQVSNAITKKICAEFNNYGYSWVLSKYFRDIEYYYLIFTYILKKKNILIGLLTDWGISTGKLKSADPSFRTVVKH